MGILERHRNKLLSFCGWIIPGSIAIAVLITILGRLTRQLNQVRALQRPIILRTRMLIMIGRNFAVDPGGIHWVD